MSWFSFKKKPEPEPTPEFKEVKWAVPPEHVREFWRLYDAMQNTGLKSNRLEIYDFWCFVSRAFTNPEPWVDCKATLDVTSTAHFHPQLVFKIPYDEEIPEQGPFWTPPEEVQRETGGAGAADQ